MTAMTAAGEAPLGGHTLFYDPRTYQVLCRDCPFFVKGTGATLRRKIVQPCGTTVSRKQQRTAARDRADERKKAARRRHSAPAVERSTRPTRGSETSELQTTQVPVQRLRGSRADAE